VTAQVPENWERDLANAVTDIQQKLGARAVPAMREPLFRPVGELLAVPKSRTPWLVDGLIMRGGLAVIAAEPKSCKTWFATELAVAVASGGDAFGARRVEQGTVAYFYAEDLADQVRNRVSALAAGRGVDAKSITRLFVCPRGEFLDVSRHEDLAWVVASARKLGKVDLLLLDPLRDISSAAEDKSDDMSRVMRGLRLVADTLGCTVAITHHNAKWSADRAGRVHGAKMRGSNAIHGATDSGVFLSRSGHDTCTRFELSVVAEARGARSGGEFELTLEIEDDPTGAATRATWAISTPVRPMKKTSTNDAEAKVRRALADTSKPLSKRALRQIGGSKDKVDSVIANLERAGEITNVGTGNSHGWVLSPMATAPSTAAADGLEGHVSEEKGHRTDSPAPRCGV
jgi:hypothetical protein